MTWILIFTAILTVGGFINFTIFEDIKDVEDINYASGRLLYVTPGPVEFDLNDETSQANRTLSLSCKFEVHNYSNTRVEWLFKRNDNILLLEGFTVNIEIKNETQLISTNYEAEMSANLFDAQTGTYMCRVWDSLGAHYLTGQTDVLLYAPPKVKIEFAKAISTSEIYLTWTLYANKSRIQGFYLVVRNSTRPVNAVSSHTRTLHIDETKQNYIVSDLSAHTTYELVLVLETKTYSDDEIHYYNSTSSVIRTTLPWHFTLQPTISVGSVTTYSIGIQLSDPPSNVTEYIHYYELQLWKENNPGYIAVDFHTSSYPNKPYIFDNLNPETAYVIRARACFNYGITRCGDWSEEIRTETFSSGIPGKPRDVHIDCNKTNRGYMMNLTWAPPEKAAKIHQYRIRITVNETSTSGVVLITSHQTFAHSMKLSPYTQYTVRLQAISPWLQAGRTEKVKCWTGDPNQYKPLFIHFRLETTNRGNPFSAHTADPAVMNSHNSGNILSSDEYEDYEEESAELTS